MTGTVAEKGVAKMSTTTITIPNQLRLMAKGGIVSCFDMCFLHDVAGDYELMELKILNLQAVLAAKDKEIRRLQEDLLEYGQHLAGCNYPHGAEYGCKCGWLKIKVEHTLSRAPDTEQKGGD